MSNKTKFLSIFVLLIFLSVGVFSQGFQRGNQKPMQMKRGHHFMSPLRLYNMLKMQKDQFNITDDQLNKLKSLSFYFEEKKTKLTNENRTLRLKLKEELANTKINYQNVRNIMDKMSKNRTELFIEGLKAKEEINKILTPEQLTKIRQYWMSKMRTRMNRMKDMRNRSNMRRR